jgi:hypothetical protein
MFNQISWGLYVQLLILSVVLYYGFVVYKYYRHDLLQILKRRKVLHEGDSNLSTTHFNSEPGISNTTTSRENLVAGERQNEVIMPHVHDLVQQIKTFIQDVSQRSFIKEEVIMGLQIILRDYRSLKETDLQASINDLIDSECSEYCSFQLSEEEINTVWLG